MEQKTIKQVRVNTTVNKLLNEISQERKSGDHLNATKQGIVAELIIEQHKKEVAKTRA